MVTLLEFLRFSGHLEVVKFLHRAGCDLDKANNHGTTAGILAAKNGHLEVVQFLHRAGCDLDKANNDGDTAGSLAAWTAAMWRWCNFYTGPDVTLTKPTTMERTAGILAAQHGHLEVVKYLRSSSGYVLCMQPQSAIT